MGYPKEREALVENIRDKGDEAQNLRDKGDEAQNLRDNTFVKLLPIPHPMRVRKDNQRAPM